MPTPQESLAAAIEHHKAGRLRAAEEIYRRILAAEPNQPDALNLLGVLAAQSGRLDAAIEYFRRAVSVNGNSAALHNNLGNAYRQSRRNAEAAACYRRALELKPDFAEAHNNLGLALRQEGKLEEAVACCRRAIELAPVLLRIGTNHIRDQLRRFDKERAGFHQAPLDDERAQSTPDRDGSPDDAMAFQDRLEAVLQRRPPYHRQIVDLRAKGHTFRAIAEIVARSEGQVWRILAEIEEEVVG